MMTCYTHRDECVNYPDKCRECFAMSNIYNTHPLYEKKPMTRFEKFKNMDLDEMAEFLLEHTCCECCSRDSDENCFDVVDCKTHVKEWLESEVE